MQTEDAIDVVARKLIADLVATEAGSRWDSYPDVGEHDWERIVARARALTEPPAEYDRAYDLLTQRADPEREAGVADDVQLTDLECGDYPAPCNCDDPRTHSGH